GIVQNYRFVITDPSSSRNIGVRFNAPLSNKDRLNFNFQKQNSNSDSHQLFGFLDTGDTSGLSFNAGWSHSFRPRLINSANFSIRRSRNLTATFSDNFTWVLKRKHNLTFGFTCNRLQQNSQNYQNARGSFSFSGL